jgi:hypothetical protein
MHANPTPKIMGLAWYRPEQWTLLRAVVPDGDGLQASHAEWMKEASSRLWEFEQRGLVVRKVDVDLPQLLRWCEARGVIPDSRARADYAADCLQRTLAPRTAPMPGAPQQETAQPGAPGGAPPER